MPRFSTSSRSRQSSKDSKNSKDSKEEAKEGLAQEPLAEGDGRIVADAVTPESSESPEPSKEDEAAYKVVVQRQPSPSGVPPLPPPRQPSPDALERAAKKKSKGIPVFGTHVKVPHPPWRKKGSSSTKAAQGLTPPAGSPSFAGLTGFSPSAFSFGSPAASPRASPRTSPRAVSSTGLPTPQPFSTAKLGNIVQEVVQWSSNGDGEVAMLQARIDDMWVDEVVLGCDTEIYSGIRQAALEVEAGSLDAPSAIRQASKLAEEAETTALMSVRSRMVARDCVRFQGGMEAVQSRIKRRLTETSEQVKPYLERLKEPERAPEVVRVMERLVREAQDEYANVNAMKTAKSEVVLELQDKGSQRDWFARQLALSLDLLENSPLFLNSATPRDAEHFFVETVRSVDANDPLRERTLRCLEHLRLWGNAAAGALAALGAVDVDDTDCGNAEDQAPKDTSAPTTPQPRPGVRAAAEVATNRSPASESTSLPDLT